MSVPINPETRVGALLEAYPEIERELIAWAPAFARLRNPILRKTVAKVATLEQAAKVGGVRVQDLVRKLREVTGQGGSDPVCAVEEAGPSVRPAWVDESRIRHRIDADAMLKQGMHPIGQVRQCAASLGAGETVRLTSGFRPEPLIEAMRRTGLAVYCEEVAPGRFATDICRVAGAAAVE